MRKKLKNRDEHIIIVILLFLLAVYAFVGIFLYYVLPLTLIGFILSLTSDRYRRWICAQPFFSKLPGFRKDQPIQLAIVTLVYFLPPCILAFIISNDWKERNIGTEMIFGLIGLIVIVYFVWFHRFFKEKSLPPTPFQKKVSAKEFPDTHLYEMDPFKFEHFIAGFFRQTGYEVEVTKRSKDGGVDMFIRKKGRMGIVQCKRYKGTVGEPAVRDLYGTMNHYHADEAYLVTTGLFSLPAQKFAEAKPIQLVDQKELKDWLTAFRVE